MSDKDNSFIDQQRPKLSQGHTSVEGLCFVTPDPSVNKLGRIASQGPIHRLLPASMSGVPGEVKEYLQGRNGSNMADEPR
jgi:hypothetical protein